MDEDTETTDFMMFSKMKRNFNNMIGQQEPVMFHGVKQSLQFGDTPPKMMKVQNRSCGNLSSSRLSITTPGGETYDHMQQKLSLKQADIISQKATITKLGEKISKLESDLKESEINHDGEISKMKAALDREVAKSLNLQSKLQYLMEKEKIARDELEEIRKEGERQKVEMDKKILKIQREKLEEGDKAHQSRSKWLEKESDLREEIMELKLENTSLKSKYEDAEAQLKLRKRFQQDNEEQSSQGKALLTELTEEKEKNKELTAKLSEYEENIVITNALKQDLDQVPSMKRELETLRMDNEQLRHNEQNTLLLEEELRGVKKCLEEALTKCRRLTELEITNEDLQARLQRWEACDDSGSRRPQSPSSLSRRVNELETSQAMMLLKQGDVESELNREKQKLKQALSERGKLSLDLTAEKNTVSQQNDLIKRLKRKILLLSKERDSYKSVLDSYESEATINFNTESQRRIQSLEELVQNYQSQSDDTERQLNSMENQLSNAQILYEKAHQQLVLLQSGVGGSGQSSKQDQDTIRQLKEQNAVLENSLLTIQEEKDILAARIEQRQLQGDYDPSKVKVIHMLKNPISEAEEEREKLVEQLTAENDNLRKRNELLEMCGGEVEDLTIQVNEKLLQPSPTKELEATKKELKRQETRYQRLMEVYSKTSREFREICYQLTGYKIDIPCSNQYRLTNLYSLSPNDYLWFQQNEQGEIQMLQTDFSNSLKDLMEKYLQKKQSIPLFLSQVTMDLYSKQTLIVDDSFQEMT